LQCICYTDTAQQESCLQYNDRMCHYFSSSTCGWTQDSSTPEKLGLDSNGLDLGLTLGTCYKSSNTLILQVKQTCKWHK